MPITGKERDGETSGSGMRDGLDYFGARYFSGAQGRFTNPDEPLNDQVPSDPQSWNLYSYVRNNPLKYTDPTGQDCVYTDYGNGTIGLERGNSCSQNGGTYIEGAIDAKSFAYDSKTNSIGYTYSNAADGSGGAGSIALRDAPTYGEAFMSQMAIRRDASNQFIGEFAKQAAIGAAGNVAGRLIGVGIDAALAARVARTAAAQEAALGLGVTGTKAATTVAEKLALEAAQANPAVGKVLQTKLSDPRWPASQGWVKMESRSPGGVVVHWVRNSITGAAADFKLK